MNKGTINTFKKKELFIYFWLCQILVAVCGNLVPKPGIKPMSSVFQGGFLTCEHFCTCIFFVNLSFNWRWGKYLRVELLGL